MIQDRPWLRSNLFGVAVLFVIINMTFFPFIWGSRTLEESANEVPSIYSSGSRQVGVMRYVSTEADAGAPAWEEEPAFALIHSIVFHEKAPPIWNPYASYGTPLAADDQSQPYSPLAWVSIAPDNARAFGIFIALRLLIGALFAFLFLRLFIGFVPSLGGAVAFMFSGYYWYYLGMPHLSVEVLLPGLLYGFERVLRRPNLLTAAFFAVIVALMALGGMPESTVLALAFASLYGLARLFLESSLRARWRESIGCLLLGGAAGLGVSAIMYVPFLEYVPLSWNSHAGSLQGLQADAGPTLPTLAGYLSPLFMRPWTFIPILRGFFGCSALFFALVAFFSGVSDAAHRKADRIAIAELLFGTVALVLLAKRFGLPIVNWIGSLPVLREINFVKYEEAEIGCCIALLAGFGIARLCERRTSSAAIWPAALVPFAILSGGALQTQQQFSQLTWGQIYYTAGLVGALAFLALAAAAALALAAGKITPLTFTVAALTLVTLEPLSTYVVPVHYVANTPAAQSTSPLLGVPYVDFLKSSMRNHERLYGQDQLLYPQWASAFGLQDVRGLDAVYPARYLPFVRAFLLDNGPSGDNLGSRFVGVGDDITTPASQRFLALSSVRYVLSTGDITRSADYRRVPAFRKVRDFDGVGVFEFASPLPRISIFQRIVSVTTPDQALQEIALPSFDPYSEVVAEGTSPAFAGLSRSPRAKVKAGTIEEYTSTYVRARVATDRPAVAVLNDTNFPGWQAFIDGRPADTFYANYLFRGILLPAGAHVVEFRYEPASFATGRAISIVSLLAIGCIALAGFLWRKRSAAPAPVV